MESFGRLKDDCNWSNYRSENSIIAEGFLSTIGMPEYFDVVDENDKIIGIKPKAECLAKGLLHRAILVFLLNEKNEVYIQRRAKNALFYGGFWSASCTGHVSSGETYDDAAKREMIEELAVKCNPKEKGKFISPKWNIGSLVEWEIITVFEAACSRSEE